MRRERGGQRVEVDRIESDYMKRNKPKGLNLNDTRWHAPFWDVVRDRKAELVGS